MSSLAKAVYIASLLVSLFLSPLARGVSRIEAAVFNAGCYEAPPSIASAIDKILRTVRFYPDDQVRYESSKISILPELQVLTSNENSLIAAYGQLIRSYHANRGSLSGRTVIWLTGYLLPFYNQTSARPVPIDIAATYAGFVLQAMNDPNANSFVHNETERALIGIIIGSLSQNMLAAPSLRGLVEGAMVNKAYQSYMGAVALRSASILLQDKVAAARTLNTPTAGLLEAIDAMARVDLETDNRYWYRYENSRSPGWEFAQAFYDHLINRRFGYSDLSERHRKECEHLERPPISLFTGFRLPFRDTPNSLANLPPILQQALAYGGGSVTELMATGELATPEQIRTSEQFYAAHPDLQPLAEARDRAARSRLSR